MTKSPVESSETNPVLASMVIQQRVTKYMRSQGSAGVLVGAPGGAGAVPRGGIANSHIPSTSTDQRPAANVADTRRVGRTALSMRHPWQSDALCRTSGDMVGVGAA